jgi:hypothetical protein
MLPKPQLYNSIYLYYDASVTGSVHVPKPNYGREKKVGPCAFAMISSDRFSFISMS